MAVRSFTSSSDAQHRGEPVATRPGFVRQTASDRPGVAQPVPERDIPERAWGRIWIGAVVLAVVLTGLWEWHWRAYGAIPSYRNSDGQWIQQRRRIDNGEGNALVLVGSSRTMFDMQLPVWKKVTGEQPIQLALEGTSALPAMEDLAADPKFHGRLMVGVATSLFFTGFDGRFRTLKDWRKQTITKRVGTWLSMRLFEPYLAFYQKDFALRNVMARWPWPSRTDKPPYEGVRKLSMSDADRNAYMWPKVVNDKAYRDMARRIWAQQWSGPYADTFNAKAVAKRTKAANAAIDRAVKAVKLLRAHGARVVFVRQPVIGPYYAYENRIEPPAKTWERLLKRTGAPGISFTDEPQLQGFKPPEWSHLKHADARIYTARLAPKVERLFAQQATGQVANVTGKAQ